MKQKHQRMIILLLAMLSLAIGVGILSVTLKRHIVFFVTPSELTDDLANQSLRIGGLVEEKSIIATTSLSTEFRLTDHQASITIRYHGILPTLFRENQGIVATGMLHDDGIFYASELLAKHDENYMPKALVDQLKEQELFQPKHAKDHD
jgi:cytochrome c-type biogenesis protein CcmE